MYLQFYKKLKIYLAFKVKNSNLKAFSLVELLVVMALTAILATVGTVNFVGYRNKQEVDLTAQEIVAVLRNAQDRSIAQESGSRYGVHFDNIDFNNGFYSQFQGASYTVTSSTVKSPLRTSIKFISPASGASTTVVFSPITGLPNSSTTIIISLKTGALSSSTIFINSNGQIQY